MTALLKGQWPCQLLHIRSLSTTASEYVRCFQDRAHVLPLEGTIVIQFCNVIEVYRPHNRSLLQERTC